MSSRYLLGMAFCAVLLLSAPARGQGFRVEPSRLDGLHNDATIHVFREGVFLMSRVKNGRMGTIKRKEQHKQDAHKREK